MRLSNAKKLGAVVTITKGKKHSIVKSASSTSKRLIGIDDLRNDDFYRFTNDKSGTYAVSSDVLIAWDGANAGTIGYGKIGFIGSTIARLRLNEKEKFYTPFLALYLKSQFSYLRKTSTGATIPHINRKALKNITIPKIELEDQKCIAYLLTRIESLISKREKNLKQLEDLKKSIFMEMFGDLSQWDFAPIEFLALKGKGSFTNGPFGSNLLTSELVEEGVPVIYIRDIRNAKYQRISTVCVTQEKAHELDTCQVHPGDVLIAKVGDPPGISAVYPQDEPNGIITQDVIRIRPDLTKTNPNFISGYINSVFGKRMIKEITVEATRARFGLRQFKAQEIACPPKKLQNQYSNTVITIEGLILQYQKSLQNLDTLYGTLSQKAFKGELDLSLVPITNEKLEASEGISHQPDKVYIE